MAGETANTSSGNEVESKNAHVKESMFLKGTDEKEIIDIVKGFQSKKSTDWNDIDMSMVKSIIDCVMIPITCIYNQSLKTGVFPSKMKTAKVIPIYKAGDRHILFLCFRNSLKYWKKYYIQA